MRFSRAAGIALALAMVGCAGAAAPPPAPSPTPGATATAPPPGGGTAAAGARTVDPRFNPSEEITAEELASIPEPVPGASPARATAPSAAPAPVAADPPAAPAPAGAGALEPASSGAAWRVQIFASPELAVADSVAKLASAHLEAPYVIEYEGRLYKVRLGAFASEQEALALRERAIQSGFLGAFRVKSGEVPVRSKTK